MADRIPNSLLGITMPDFDAGWRQSLARELIETGMSRDPAVRIASYLVDHERIKAHRAQLMSRLLDANNPLCTAVSGKAGGALYVRHICVRARGQLACSYYWWETRAALLCA